MPPLLALALVVAALGPPTAPPKADDPVPTSTALLAAQPPSETTVAAVGVTDAPWISSTVVVLAGAGVVVPIVYQLTHYHRAESVPEPASFAALGLGAYGIRRRRKA